MGCVGWLVALDCDLEWQQQGMEPLRRRRRVSSEMDGWMMMMGLWNALKMDCGLDWSGVVVHTLSGTMGMPMAPVAVNQPIVWEKTLVGPLEQHRQTLAVG